MPAEISGESSVAVEYFSEENCEMGKKDHCTEVAQEVIKASNPPSFTSKIAYEVSLQYTKYSCNSWWSKIEGLNLYLGAIPLKNNGHFEELQKLGITHVISVLEDFEMEAGWINTPVKHSDWEEAGISVKHIPAPDFYGLNKDEIREGVKDLHEALEKGKTVYLHCKAGRGRSATVLVAYLMEHHGYTLEKAISLVKEYRPDINLNADQQQSIKAYFGDVSPKEGYITEETFAKYLNDLLSYVIHGGNYSIDHKMPDALKGWLPKVDVQSTLERRNRYLRECRGNQDEAVKTSIERNHGMMRRLKILAANAIPVVGGATSYSITLWHQLREIALIAALHGHDLNDPDVQKKILLCLIGGNLQKVPAEAVDILARKVAKEIIKRAIGNTISVGIPTHLIFNYITDNSAKVSTHAIETFGGENSKPIPSKDYL